MKIKATQIYDWDAEPVDERPSEFMHSGGYAAVSRSHSTAQAPRKSPPHARLGFASLLVAVLTVLALGAFAVVKLAPLLRG